MAWIKSGDLVYQVDIQEGFENIPQTPDPSVHREEPGQAVAEARRSGLSRHAITTRRFLLTALRSLRSGVVYRDVVERRSLRATWAPSL